MVHKDSRDVFICTDGEEFPTEEAAREHEVASVLRSAKFPWGAITDKMAAALSQHLLANFQITHKEETT